MFGKGSDLWFMLMLPQEMVMAVWLIAKAFGQPASPVYPET